MLYNTLLPSSSIADFSLIGNSRSGPPTGEQETIPVIIQAGKDAAIHPDTSALPSGACRSIISWKGKMR
jgi:hypothetical protein